MNATEPQAWRNGNWVPTASLTISCFDPGFVQGVTVVEQLRTFAGRPFAVREHFDRFEASLHVVGLRAKVDRNQLGNALEQLAASHATTLPQGHDLRIVMWATPGSERSAPDVALYAQPLDFGTWVGEYQHGAHLITSPYRQVPPVCWPATLKCRSRMHYYLADRHAREAAPGARALLLDTDDHICETSTANVLVYDQQRGIRVPRAAQVLGGISQSVVRRLAARRRVAWEEADLTSEDVREAEEVWLASTPFCLLPVARLDQRPVGNGKFLMCYALLEAWGEEVGVDVVAQARRQAGGEGSDGTGGRHAAEDPTSG